jgi:hypothetical protein
MKTKLLSLFCGLLAVLVTPLCAQNLVATHIGIDPGLMATGTITGSQYTTIRTGENDFDVFSGFCTDPTQGLNIGETIVYTIQDPITLNNLGTVQRVLDGYYNHSAQTNLDAAGAQWAIWEAIEDGVTAPSFDVGLVQLDSSSMDIETRALDYLNNLANYQPMEVFHMVSDVRQDIITPVPEPATTSLIVGLLGLLALRRRRS